MKELWELFIVFAKIGGFTFGGGYAMLPILQREVVENRNWATSEELMDYYAIGQCTPGIIAVNTATFIGYKRKGIIGGIVATIGCVFPSLVIIMIIISNRPDKKGGKRSSGSGYSGGFDNYSSYDSGSSYSGSSGGGGSFGGGGAGRSF